MPFKIITLLSFFLTNQVQRQISLDDDEEQERILTLLSVFDKTQKSAGLAADPKISGIKGKCQKVFSQKEICISATGFANILYI